MTLRPLALLAWLLAAAPLVAAPVLAQAPAPATGAARPAPPRPATSARASAAAPAGPALIDINSADEKALDTLPGVGPARAKAIVAGRPYTDKQDLLTKKILPANVFAAVQDKLALANVNTASAADMAKTLPNVGPVRAAAIVKNRPYGSLQELVTKGALTQGVFEGIKTLVTTGS